MLALLVISGLLTVVFSHNILFTIGLPGSHLFSSYHLASLLASRGHNVTMVTAAGDARLQDNNPLVRVIVSPLGFQNEQEFKEVVNPTNTIIANLPTKYSGAFPFYGFQEARLSHSVKSGRVAGVFCDPHMDQIVREGEFDVVVMEMTSAVAVTHAARMYNWSQPVVNYLPIVTGVTRKNLVSYTTIRAVHQSIIFRSIMRLNGVYPSLISSEPSIFYPMLDGPTSTFLDRVWALYQLFQFGKTILFSHPHLPPLPNSAPPAKKASLNIIMGHPAFSFPYLTPLTTVYIADAFLNGDGHPLNNQFTAFLDNCERTVLFSLGSVFPTLPGEGTLLRELVAMGICIIAKSPLNETRTSSDGKILYSHWLPQTQILESGRIAFFISHCGQNSKLESIGAGVPLLCIPIAWDQLTNAATMKMRGFGLIAKKEDMENGEMMRGVIREMLARRDEFSANERRAVEIVRGTGGFRQFLFLLDHLVQYGELGYLRNEVTQNQGVYEMYNIDVVLVTIATIVLTVIAVKMVVMKTIRVVSGLFYKPKTD
eukprot:sb/3463690/